MYSATDQIVSDYLDDVEHLLQQADATSVAVMAPTELARTVHALRAILADHAPDASGRCHRCATRRPWSWAWWRVSWRRAWPCRTWQTAHQHLVTAAPAQPTGPISVIGGPR